MRTHLVLPFLILSLLFIPVYLQPIRQVFHFMLALQWPNSYCTGPRYCEPPIPQNFTIHGFWPMDYHGHVMSNKVHHGEVYLKSVAPGIEKELNESWPNLQRKIHNYDFWNYEWGKHGQGFGFTPNNYFRLAIQCKRKLDHIIGGDLAQYLKGIGFGPDATVEYGNQQFPKKITDKIHFIVEIQCNKADGKFQLWEIYICFTATGGFRDCNYDYTYNHKRKFYKAQNCGRRIIFPTEKEPRRIVKLVSGT